MKITHIYIENFGKLHQLHYTFTEDITQILQENGFGKTTFASFIKAIFYGLPTVRQNAKESNDRQQYAPFNGGKFGGNIDFIYKEKQFRIERFFDRKSDKKDSLKVYCNGKELANMPNDLGKKFFDLDKESFEKTTFVTAEFLESSTTTAMQEKLGQFVDSTTRECNYATALESLERAKKELKHQKGKGGKIYDLECQQKTCHMALNELNQITTALEKEYVAFNALKVELEQQTENIEKNVNISYALKRYTEYKEKIEALQKQIAIKKTEYPHGLPTSAEFESLKQLSTRYLQLKNTTIPATYTKDKEEEQQKLQQQFASATPTDDDLQKVRKWITKQEELKAEIVAHQKTIALQNNQPVPQPTSSTKNSTRSFGILKLFAFILGIVGIVSAKFVAKPLQYFLLFGGVLLFLVGVVWTTMGGKKQSSTPTVQPNSTLPVTSTNLQDTNATLLQEELTKYTTLLVNFFQQYGYTDNAFLENLTDLKYKLIVYRNLQQEQTQKDRHTMQIDEESIAIKAQIHTILQQYALSMQANWKEQIEQLEQVAQSIAELQRQLQQEEQEAQNYFTQHNLAELQSQEDSLQTMHCTDSLEQKRQEFAHLANRIADMEQRLYMRTSYENELEKVTKALQVCKEEYTLLEQTIEALQQAEENLKNRYLRPLQNKLESYGLQEYLGVALQLDSNYNLHFESYGERHSSKHLSNGQRTLALFVLRLAFMEQLSTSIQPPLILDDPFLHLDKQNMEVCKQILNTIAKDRQILYFCCHSSRKII